MTVQSQLAEPNAEPVISVNVNDGKSPCSQMANLMPTPPPPGAKYGIYHQFRLEAELARSQLSEDQCVECISTLPKLTFGFMYVSLVAIAFIGNVYLIRELIFTGRNRRPGPRKYGQEVPVGSASVTDVLLAMAVCDIGW